ncbi:MAG: cupin domain-containing protein, partial [Bacillota bacterium]
MATIVDPPKIEGRAVTEDGASGLQYQTLFGAAPGRRLNSNLVTVASGGRTRSHQHDWEQINFILGGAGRVVVDGGEARPIAAGQAVHFDGGEPH